jgi:hypothetical protein
VEDDGDEKTGVFESSYVLVTAKSGFFTHPLLKNVATRIQVPAGMRRWTDDYSNLWQALTFDN